MSADQIKVNEPGDFKKRKPYITKSFKSCSSGLFVEKGRLGTTKAKCKVGHLQQYGIIFNCSTALIMS